MSKDKIIKQIPNILTISRIVGSILLAFTAPVLGIGLTTIVVGALALTDLFDGFLARKLNATSELGGKLDAISDKLFIAIIMYVTIRLGSPYAKALIFPIAGETSIAVLNTVKYKLGYRPQTIIKGKIKTWALSGFVIATFLQMEFEFLKSAVECLLASTLVGQIMTFMGYCDQENELEKDKKIYNKIDEIKNKIKAKRKSKIKSKSKSIKIEPINKEKGDDLNMEKDEIISNIKENLRWFTINYRRNHSLSLREMSKTLNLSPSKLSEFEMGMIEPTYEFFDKFLNKFYCNKKEMMELRQLFIINNEKKVIETKKVPVEDSKIIEITSNGFMKIPDFIPDTPNITIKSTNLKSFLQNLRTKNEEGLLDMANKINIDFSDLLAVDQGEKKIDQNIIDNLIKIYDLSEEEIILLNDFNKSKEEKAKELEELKQIILSILPAHFETSKNEEKRSYRKIMEDLREKNNETVEIMAERIAKDIEINIKRPYLDSLENMSDEVPINFTNVLSRLYELTDEEKSELQQAIFEQRKIVNGNTKSLDY